MEATKKSCEHFKGQPIALINFFEGTRFTPSKHEKQQSTFQHLLKPKAGGAAFTLEAMDGAITKLIDFTIVYPNGKKNITDLFANRVKKIVVRVNVYDIPEEFIGKDYQKDEVFKVSFQEWINDIWVEKDKQIENVMQSQ